VNENKYRRLFEDSADGITLGEPETGIVTDCNQPLADLVSRSKYEIIGQHQRILHPIWSKYYFPLKPNNSKDSQCVL